MRKTLLYLALLAIFAIAVYLLLFKDKDVFGVDEAGFKVEDTGAIAKIFMADKSGNTILLRRRENGWTVNDKYPAIYSPVYVLMQTLVTQTAMYPVPETMHNNIIKILATRHVKVELYDKDDKKMRVFYVGGQAGTAGSYMLIEGAKHPYVVQIPGFEGYITTRYSTDIADWRDRVVCNIPQGQLQSVSVQYPTEPLNSFTLKQDAGKITVLVDAALIKDKKLNLRRATVYTKFFEKLYAEGYINGVTKLDSIISSVTKRCIIDVTGTNGQKQHAEIYWMPLNRRSKNMLTPDPTIPEAYDADRFYAVINDMKDTVIVQRETFEKTFRKAYEFYQPDDTTTHVQVDVNERGAKAGSFKVKGSH